MWKLLNELCVKNRKGSDRFTGLTLFNFSRLLKELNLKIWVYLVGEISQYLKIPISQYSSSLKKKSSCRG